MRTLALCTLLLTYLVSLVGPVAHAAPKKKPNFKAAKRLFVEGMELFEREDYLKAAEKFQSAYNITKDPIVLFNVGEAYARAGKNKQAIAAYEGYLEGKPTQAEREQVQRKISELRRKNSPRAPVATAPPPPPPPPEPTPVESGRPSRPLFPVPPPLTSEPPPPPVPAERSNFLTIAAWTGLGLTVALATTATLLTLAAHTREEDIARRQAFRDPGTGQPADYNAGSTKADYLNLNDEGESYKNMSVVFFVLAGAMAGTTATLFIIRGLGDDEPKRAQLIPGVPLTASAGPGRAQVGLKWSF